MLTDLQIKKLTQCQPFNWDKETNARKEANIEHIKDVDNFSLYAIIDIIEYGKYGGGWDEMSWYEPLFREIDIITFNVTKDNNDIPIFINLELETKLITSLIKNYK